MNLSQIVCSLDNAKRLKELGVPQESIFDWVAEGEHYFMTDLIPESKYSVEQSKPPYSFPYISKGSAFTASELMELLPSTLLLCKEDPLELDLTVMKVRYEFDVTPPHVRKNDEYSAFYHNGVDDSGSFGERSESLPDALALLLIHLIENSYYEPRMDTTMVETDATLGRMGKA